MNISRIIIADNQPLTALAVETLCKQLTTNGHNQEAEIVYATNKYELGVLLKQRVNCAVIIDYTLFNFDNQDNFAMMCDLYQETSSWLLLSDELTADFLRFVLYQTTNVSVSYKDSPIDIIREALRFVLRGERYIAQHAMNILLLSETEQPHVNTDLTQTELEILKAMTQGKLTKEIEFGLLDIDKTIRIYADSKKIWMMGKTFDFKDIRSVSLETETRTGSQKIMATSSTDTLGTIGRSVAGAVVGGSTGALIGAGTAKHKTVIEKEGGYNTTSYIVDVKTNILNTPVVTVRFESDRDKALELYSTLELIIEQTHKESEQ